MTLLAYIPTIHAIFRFQPESPYMYPIPYRLSTDRATTCTPHPATPTPTPDDDSDGELFVEDSRDHRRVSASASRSPGSIAAQASSAKAASAYTVNAPSVYRAPTLEPPASAAPAPPALSSNPQAAAEALAGAIAVADGDDRFDEEETYGRSAGEAAGGRGSSAPLPGPRGGGAEHESMSSQRVIPADSSAEAFSSGAGFKGGLAGGLRLGGDRYSIPRDGSTLEVRFCLPACLPC